MKNLILVFTILFTTLSCSKSDDSDHNVPRVVIKVTLDGAPTQLAQMGALWETPEAKTNSDLYNFKLPTPVPMSQLARLSVMYLDLIGNSYNIGYQAQ